MANTADSLFANGDMSCACPTALNSLAKGQLGLDLHISCLAKACHDARFVEYGVCSAHAALEVKFKFLHGLCVRDQFEGCVGGESGAVFGEKIDCGVMLGRIAVWRG